MPQVKSLRWEQIDPRIAAQVGQTLAATRSTDASSLTTETIVQSPIAPESLREQTEQASGTRSEYAMSAASRTLNRTRQVGAYTEGEQLEPIWTVFSAACAFLIVCLYMSICFNLTGPLGTLLIALLPAALIGACVVPAALTRDKGIGASPRVHLRGPITLAAGGAEPLRGAFEAAPLARAERLYGDVILHLAAPQTASREQVRLRRTLLRRCNALLADHFRIVRERERVEQLLSRGDASAATTVAQITDERDLLAIRRDREADPIARASLTESVKLIEERLLSVQALGPTLARLDAHDEAICQALSLAHAALTHADASPVALRLPDVASVRRALRQTGRDLRAMEAAVEELEASLGSSK